MNYQKDVDILLVEDNPRDTELTIRALNKHNITNKLVVLEDGAEALDLLFCKGKYAERDITIQPMDTSGDAGASFTAPELAVDAKGQRWLGYIEGPKDRGQLRIVPLGKDLQPVGRSFSVTSANQSASEVRIQTLDDGRLVVAYLRDTDGKTELVTEELGCEVKR